LEEEALDEEAAFEDEEAALLEAAWLAAWLVASAVPDSVGAVSPVQAARPKVIRAANEAKILTFFINLSATVKLRFLSFGVFRFR
jgi:hypothetical protein